jgi:DNA-binding transcriptional LysR family regulator
MARNPISDLSSFIAIAREKSFTRAAAQLGVTPSALSHTVKGLEERLGVRLLTRTTRSVSVTDAGERLLTSIGPRFDEIHSELESVASMRGKPAGTIRITSGETAATTILWPKLALLLADFPDIKIEISVDQALVDIVAARFDAGVRLGESISKDMIAMPIGPDISMAAVAAPGYFTKHGRPAQPADLARHTCINLRMATYGGLYAWEFEKDGRELRVRVEGQLVFNTTSLVSEAALQGHGIAYLPEDIVLAHTRSGSLERVLQDWCPAFAGYHLYYPSRRQMSPAFRVVVEALRYSRI